jgi:predicted ribosome quality control (RQC) complex YloA/Tae2 family protein
MHFDPTDQGITLNVSFPLITYSLIRLMRRLESPKPLIKSLEEGRKSKIQNPLAKRRRALSKIQISSSYSFLSVLQPFDFTTLMAACSELQADWLPARLEQVYQRDRFTLSLALRTLKQRAWLTLSWHPQAARICLDTPPPRTPDTFTFSQQLWHQLNGLALVAMMPIAPWERVLDLQFARRPGDPILWHLYVEIMGKYSNVILANAENLMVTAAHQVSAQQSSVRPIQTGQPYEKPPALTESAPSLEESQAHWQERLSLIPGSLRRNLFKNYRGLSSALVFSMVQSVGLDPEQPTESLNDADWQNLFESWQQWLTHLQEETFSPGWLQSGYTVMGWGIVSPAASVQELVRQYYGAQNDRQDFNQLRQQLQQKLKTAIEKLRVKAQVFQTRLQQSDQAELYRQQADLLMAYLQDWQPGMQAIVLADFETGKPVTIPLNPEKNAVQNAQALYKLHQKLKRARNAIDPLLADVQAELGYLEQVEASLLQLTEYQHATDLEALIEIRDELVQQNYLEASRYRNSANASNHSDAGSQPHRYQTPNGFELLVGRNNRQNDQLTFRLAGDYDLWFHTQEIPGSHVLLRLTPGSVAEDADLAFAADIAAYYSRARQSEQVPVVYTEPKYVFKPKGVKPGMVVYKQERILWGQPQQGSRWITQKSQLN